MPRRPGSVCRMSRSGPGSDGRPGAGPPAPTAREPPPGPARRNAVRAAHEAARTGGCQPITLSIVSVAAFHASAGLVPRFSMLLICVEIVSLIVASFGPSTVSGMALASSA